MGTEELQNENENVQGQTDASENQPVGTDDSSSQQAEPDLYAPYLERFPESLHPIAREVFKEWDGQVTKKFQTVQSEIEPYKPIIDAYDPDSVRQAVAIAEAMEENPQKFMEALIQAYDLTPYQGQQLLEQAQQQEQVPQALVDPANSDPRLQQHEEMLRALAETILTDRQQREQEILIAQQEEEYEQTMSSLHEKYGEFDVLYVNTLLANGVEPEQAVQMWQQAVGQYAQKQLTPNQTAPRVMSAGGGTPSIQRDVETLSSQDTRKLVEDMLRAASES